MVTNDLEKVPERKLSTKSIKIVDISKVNGYLFIKFDNNQNILTNSEELYDVSGYNHLLNIFNIGEKLCVVMKKEFSLCVMDLKSREILFEDKNVYHISKQDDRTLYVIMQPGWGNNTIYDIEEKKYLPVPDNYEFESSLGNGLYVFKEQHNSKTNFYEYKRCVINIDGKMLLKDIDGYVELSKNYLIILKKNKLCVLKINEDSMVTMKTIEQNGNVIAKPAYHAGNIIIMEKGVIKIYTPDLQLVNEFLVDELNEIIDYEIVSDTLKLCLPYTINKKKINKHLFINLNTGKKISHLRIEGYPYWTPTTYVGQDSIDSGVRDYHFYNADFEPIIKVSANSYESVASVKEHMFILRTQNEGNECKQLLNTENGSIRDVTYDYIHFHLSLPFGYGVNTSTQKMDFFDEYLSIIIPDFDYRRFDLGFRHDEFNYFIINNYICVCKHYVGNFGQDIWRTIIQKADGEVVLDSVQHKCYAIGNFIKIVHNKDTEFLNTITGKIENLGISASLDEEGKIDFREDYSPIVKKLLLSKNDD